MQDTQPHLDGFTVDLFAATERAQVGGKALNLQRAWAGGMQVPAGFVIPCRALGAFLDANGLRAPVQAYLAQVTQLSVSAQNQLYASLCAAVTAAPLPAELERAVAERAGALFDVAPAGLAVRSSAGHEDAAHSSFAGVYASTVGVHSLSDLWDAIRRGWCASWSPGALAYARRMNIDLQPDGLALLVQPVLAADTSGVLASAELLTGNPWRFVLNATFGLAQDVMHGGRPADRYVVDWSSGDILERRVVPKTTQLHAGPQGIVESAVPPDRQNRPALTDEQLRRLAQVALELDCLFDCRVDVEWVLVGDDLWIVQVRPLTALPSFFPHNLTPTEAELTWTPSDPVWYRPVKPGELLVAPFYRDRWALELWLRYWPGGSFPQQSGLERDFNGYRYQTEWRWEATRYSPDETIAWLERHEEEMRARWETQQATMQEICRRSMAAAQQARSAADLIPSLLALRDAEIDFQAATWGAPQWMIFTCEWLMQEFLRDIAPDFAIGSLLQGLPCLSQTRTETAQALGRAIDEPAVRAAFLGQPLDQVLPFLVQHHPDCRFLAGYEAFCWQFGMSPPTWPAAWREDANEAQVLLAIKRSMQGEGLDAQTVLESGARSRAQAEATLRTLLERHDRALLPRFQQLLAWAHYWTPQLDNRGWLAGYIYVRLRSLIRQTGAMLNQAGVLDDAADLMLLTPADLSQIATTGVEQQRQIVLQRKHDYARNRRLTPPTWLGRPPAPTAETQTEPQDTPASPAHGSPGTSYQGDGLAPGRVTGIARKTGDLGDAAFLDSLTGEDILIYPGYRTWPDWLSLFMVVKGVVTVQGVQLHHAAQIARECGVPYINLPADVWASIPDGVSLALDGAQGTVTILV